MRQKATTKGAEAVFLFIAELNGFKAGTVLDKLNKGKQYYLHGTLHDLDYTNEDDRSDAHENIWLERLYNELDTYYQLGSLKHLRKERALAGQLDNVFGNPNPDFEWSVPIELDASALTLIGVLG